MIRGGVLADGFLAGVWSVTLAGDEHTLTVDPFAPLSPATAAALEETGHRLLSFVGGGGKADRGEDRVDLTDA